jgi:hypothetical protein
MGFLTLKAPAIEPVTTAQLIGYGHIDPNEDQGLLSMLITSAREWAEEFTKRAFVFQTKRLLMDFFPGAVNPALVGDSFTTPFVWGPNSAMIGIQYAIRLPWPLVRQVLALNYKDPNGVTVTMQPGVNFVVDVDSQPARLTPNVGTYWPVAYIIPNAVWADYVTGYAGPITVGINQGSKTLNSTFNFLNRDIGAPISIPNAGAGGNSPLNTTIATVDANGNATVADAALATALAQSTNFGAIPFSIQQAILALAAQWYEKRLPDTNDIPAGVKALLWPYRDLRM